jgi:uncharacterized membrane protein
VVLLQSRLVLIPMGKLAPMSNARRVAFVVVMAALSNILGLPPFIVSLGVTNIHFIQIPIILTGLALGAVAGGLVGLIGATTMALTLPVPNFYILPGNAILGCVTGLLYGVLAKHEWKPVISQTISAVGAYAVQAPYVYLTDVYLARMPQPIVVTIVFTLLVEDLISVFLSHIILYRISIPRPLQKTTARA